MAFDPFDVVYIDMGQRWSSPPLTFTIPEKAWEPIAETGGGQPGHLRASFLLNAVVTVRVEIAPARTVRGDAGIPPAAPRLRVGRRSYRVVEVGVVEAAEV